MTDRRFNPDDEYDTVLPYGGPDDLNSGFAAGVATSEERARQADRDGTTAQRQADVLRYLGDWFTHGATWKQVAEDLNLHHGQASGVLSVLHKAGKVARLTERRDRCLVYVLPEHVNGRETQPQGRAKQPTDALAIALIQAEATIVRVEAVLDSWDAELHAPSTHALVAKLRDVIGRAP